MGSLIFLEDCFVDFFFVTGFKFFLIKLGFLFLLLESNGFNGAAVFLLLSVVFSIKFIGLIGDMEMDGSFLEEAGSWTILLRDPIPLIKVKVNIK
jgi:hypothetical protein